MPRNVMPHAPPLHGSQGGTRGDDAAAGGTALPRVFGLILSQTLAEARARAAESAERRAEAERKQAAIEAKKEAAEAKDALAAEKALSATLRTAQAVSQWQKLYQQNTSAHTLQER